MYYEATINSHDLMIGRQNKFYQYYNYFHFPFAKSSIMKLLQDGLNSPKSEPLGTTGMGFWLAECPSFRLTIRVKTQTRTQNNEATHWRSSAGLILLIHWLSCGFTSHSTQNGLFRRRFPKPISWLGMEKTKPNTTKARIHQSKAT